MSSVRITTTRMPYARQLAAFNQFKSAFPRFVGNMAVNFFKDSFRRQGFIDQTGVERWPVRSRQDRKKGKSKRENRRALLIKTGRLRRSIRIIRTGQGFVSVGTDVPYGRTHNEGLKIVATQHVGSYTRKAHTRTWKEKRQRVKASTIKAHTRQMNIQMPKRQFMGQSQFLNRRILAQTDFKIKQILNTR